MIMYLISGRGFAETGIGRKISEVVNCFKEVSKTEVLYGGDIPVKKESATTTNLSQYHSKWYRKNVFMRFFSESYAEMKSILHNWQTYNYIKKGTIKYELIWERSSALHCAGVLYAKIHGIPSVLEWKDHLIKDYASLFKPLSIIMEKWKEKNATYVAVESEVLKKQLVKEGVDENKIYVTYNAVNPEEFNKDENSYREVRDEFGIGKNDILVGYVGSYAFYHDSIRMVKAAKLLTDKGINNIKWLLIGDGKDKAVCEKFAKENNLLDETVIMLPFQAKEKIPRFLSAMDVTILPGSTDIICPIKVMEYMAAKSVVLVPDYECNREIINGENGLLFEPGNEISIADVLLDLSKNPDKCKKLGEEARRTVVEKLTWDKTYGAVLKQILNDIKR